MIRCLLVSPIDPEKPQAGNLKFLMGGENTYTRALLKNPAKGVEYIHFQEALNCGEISIGTYQHILRWLTRFRALPLSAGTMDIKILGNFDLVHCHAYSLRISGKKVPVVMSDSSSNFLTLKRYFSWPSWRIELTYFFRKFIHNLLSVYDLDLNLGDYSSLVVFSQFAKKLHIRHGSDPRRLEIIYPGLPVPKRRRLKKTGKNIVILFVGIWFKRKGGEILLKAYRRLSSLYPEVSLVVVGKIPKHIDISSLANITNRDWLPRSKLLKNFFPKADILVLVPPKVEGYGFVVEEAMSFGIPCLVSNIGALPELVEHGKSGFVVKPGSVKSLETALTKLVKNQKLRLKMGEAARRRFMQEFRIEESQKRLLKVYQNALNHRR